MTLPSEEPQFYTKLKEGKLVKVRKRRRRNDPDSPEGQAARQKRHYFNTATGDAIARVVWLQGRLQPLLDEWYFDDMYHRFKAEMDALTRDVIVPSMDKMCENMIRIHKFTSPLSDYDELKADGVHHMFSVMANWDPSRGIPAFSYFNMVAKNFFINRVKQHSTSKARRTSSFEAMFNQFEGGSFNIEEMYDLDTPISGRQSLSALDVMVAREDKATRERIFDRLRAAARDRSDPYHTIAQERKNEELVFLINVIQTIVMTERSPDTKPYSGRVKPSHFSRHVEEISNGKITRKKFASLIQSLRKLYSELDEED